MFWLGLDPGRTTGVAIATVTNTSLDVFSYNSEIFLKLCQDEPQIFSLIDSMFDKVIIEKFPLRTSPIYSYLDQIFGTKKFIRILPGHWKPIAKARKWKYKNISQHESDALNLLRYHFLITRNIDPNIIFQSGG